MAVDPDVKILEARVEAFKECMRMCLADLEKVIDPSKPPNTRLLQVINRLRDWSR